MPLMWRGGSGGRATKRTSIILCHRAKGNRQRPTRSAAAHAIGWAAAPYSPFSAFGPGGGGTLPAPCTDFQRIASSCACGTASVRPSDRLFESAAVMRIGATEAGMPLGRSLASTRPAAAK